MQLRDMPVSEMLRTKQAYVSRRVAALSSVQFGPDFAPRVGTVRFETVGDGGCRVCIAGSAQYTGDDPEIRRHVEEDGEDTAIAVRPNFDSAWSRAQKVLHVPQPTKAPAARRTAPKTRSGPSGKPRASTAGLNLNSIATLEATLSSRVLGQRKAVEAVVGALRRRVLLGADPERPRPVANLLFAGPSGVGKTEVARLIGSELFGKSGAFVRIDCNELFERHMAAKLIGSPPGYVGYGDDNGLLVRPLRKHRTGVILLDEVEKAHPSIFTTVLFSLLGNGSVRDAGKSTPVDATGFIVVMTSNAGTGHDRVRKVGFGAAGGDGALQESVHASLARKMPPEVFGRLDDIVVFNTIAADTAAAILRHECKRIAGQFGRGQASVTLVVDDGCIPLLLRAAQPRLPFEGARSLHRTVRRKVVDPAVQALLLTPGARRLRAVVRDGRIVVRPEDV